MAARSVSKVAPVEEKDVEAEETKAAPPRDQETTNRPPAKTPDEDTIRATLHRLATREPHSFHQTTIYYGLMREDTPPRRKRGLLATSIGIVFLQCFVATGLSLGVNLSSCSEHSDCTLGTWCEQGLCEWCLTHNEHCCRTNSTKSCEWGEKETQDMCAACTTSKGYETFGDFARERVDSMMLQDWLALGLASLVVAFAVFVEMRDCLLCEKSLRDIAKRREVPRGWRFAIRGLNMARYYILLPNVILSVVMLVLNDGGNVKNVCLNTVAVLFLLEVDNLAFLHGLGERTRMEAEEMTGAHVTDEVIQTINTAKFVCVLAIPGVVLAGPWGAWVVTDFPETFGVMISPLPSMIVLFLQRMKASRRKLKGACGALGWGLAAYLLWLIWYFGMNELTWAIAHEENGLTFDDD